MGGKSAGMQPNPLRLAPSPYASLHTYILIVRDSVARFHPNGTTLHLCYITLWFLHFTPVQEKYTMYRKVLDVHRMKGAGPSPVEDYLTSLLLCTSMQGNLAEPPTVPTLPLPLCLCATTNWILID